MEEPTPKHRNIRRVIAVTPVNSASVFFPRRFGYGGPDNNIHPSETPVPNLGLKPGPETCLVVQSSRQRVSTRKKWEKPEKKEDDQTV